MLRMMLGIALGFAAGYLYGSERARDEALRRFSNAPEPVRQATERLSGAISGAPVPDVVKQAATRATAAVQTATEQATRAPTQMADAAQADAAKVVDSLSESLQNQQPGATST